MKFWRSCRRLAAVLRRVWSGWRQIVTDFPRLAPDQREARVQAWALDMLHCLGVQLDVQGQVPRNGPLLLVANHISWLDILVMHAARHCRFVSKADVKRWPVVGTLATGAGTLYIERSSRRDALRVVHDMAQALRDGDVLAVFPEGTTSNGQAMLPFHANLLQAAISAPAPVLPVALQYLDPATGAPTRAASYVGDESLVGSVWRTLSADGVRAVLHFGTPEQALGRDRREMARELHAAVAALRTLAA